jgi:DNA-binding NtrC family response regulator
MTADMTSPPAVVLLVDDEPAALKGLCLTLRGEPYRVLTAPSAVQALAILSKEPVDVVVSDERMPGMRGGDFLDRVRLSHPRVIRLVLTGETDLRVTARLIRDCELYRFLSKPIRPDDLRRALLGAVQVKRVGDAASRLRQPASKATLPAAPLPSVTPLGARR